jgi:hypothetical protein
VVLKLLREHQQAALDGLRLSFRAGKRRPMLSLATGSGKCLGLGTPVMLFDGAIVPAEDVRPGDLLMGPDSAPRRVLSSAHLYSGLFR